MKKILQRATAVVFTLTLTACASPDFADRLDARGVEATNIAESFRRGQKLVDEGNSNIKSGEKLVSRGENSISKGRTQIREGEALKASAKAAYCSQASIQDPECS